MSLKSIFNFIISEAVDEWIQHGDHHYVEQRYHLVLFCGVSRLGNQVDEYGISIEQSDCNKVGGAGEEDLVTLGGAHLQNNDEDVNIGYSNDKYSNHNDSSTRSSDKKNKDTVIK